jgi:hypothetical protein
MNIIYNEFNEFVVKISVNYTYEYFIINIAFTF